MFGENPCIYDTIGNYEPATSLNTREPLAQYYHRIAFVLIGAANPCGVLKLNIWLCFLTLVKQGTQSNMLLYTTVQHYIIPENMLLYTTVYMLSVIRPVTLYTAPLPCILPCYLVSYSVTLCTVLLPCKLLHYLLYCHVTSYTSLLPTFYSALLPCILLYCFPGYCSCSVTMYTAPLPCILHRYLGYCSCSVTLYTAR